MNDESKKEEPFSNIQIEEVQSVTLIQGSDRRENDRRKNKENSINVLSGLFEYVCYFFIGGVCLLFVFSNQVKIFFPLWQNVYILIFIPFLAGVGLFFQSEKYSD